MADRRCFPYLRGHRVVSSLREKAGERKLAGFLVYGDGTMSPRRLFSGAQPSGDFMSQTILVTGASSGIGQSTARLLAERGYTVFGTARKPDSAKREPFTILALDVRSDESVRACVEQVIAKAGRLDVLVNNAGYAMMGAAEEVRLELRLGFLDTRLFGIVRMVNAVLPRMRAASAGKIINISSLAGNTAIPFSAFYSATKFAVEGYSESLWYELRPLGIHVSLVEPGFVNTPIGEASPVAARPLPAYAATRTRMLAAFGHALEGGIPA